MWRVTAVPEDSHADHVVGCFYREHGGEWQTRGDSGRWVGSGWSSLAEMRGAGYVLTEAEEA